MSADVQTSDGQRRYSRIPLHVCRYESALQLQKLKLLLERILDSVGLSHTIAAAASVRASLWASLFACRASDDKNLQFPPVYSKRFTEHARGGTIPAQKAHRL